MYHSCWPIFYILQYVIILIRTHTYVPTYIHACIHAYTHTYLPNYIPIHLIAYIPSYVHTYIHTYLHREEEGTRSTACWIMCCDSLVQYYRSMNYTHMCKYMKACVYIYIHTIHTGMYTITLSTICVLLSPLSGNRALWAGAAGRDVQSPAVEQT